MNFLSRIIKLFNEEEPKVLIDDQESFIKTWLDDECQIQFLPEENEGDVRLLMDQIEGVNSNGNESGFTQTIERGEFTNPLASRGIARADLETLFENHGIEKIEFIERELGSKLPYSLSSEKAFRCAFDFIFDLKHQVVEQFWILPHEIRGEHEFEKLESFVNNLAIKYNLILVDWRELEVVRIKDLDVLKKHLIKYVK